MEPNPVFRGGRWRWDARPRFGQYTLKTPGPESPETHVLALRECYRLLARLAGGLRADAAGAIDPGPLFRVAARDRMAEREFRRKGGRKYGVGYVRRVVEVWGDLAVVQFRGEAGTQRLRRWRDEMAKPGSGWLAPRTRRNYLNETFAILQFAKRKGWLSDLPDKPNPCVEDETLRGPPQPRYTEGDFRALREGLYSDHDRPSGLAQIIPDRAERLDFIAKRKLYLSFGFYTGMHTKDLDSITDAWVSPDFGSYRRRNNKSSRVVEDAILDGPEALCEDIQAEIRRLGRPFRPGELICGGPWSKGSGVMQSTARRLGLPERVDFAHVFRRSTAYEYLIRGWTLYEVAHVLGHVDDRMLREVYASIPPRWRSPVKIPWDRASTARVMGGQPWTSTAQVLQFRAPAPARKLQSVEER